MGIQGLWSLTETVGCPVTLESLEGRVLAVDVSLWLHQAVRGCAAHKQTVRNPHLVTLFLRIVKLLFYRIKPIFVFDGLELPYFKKRTLERRKLKRNLASLQLNKIQRKILAEMAKSELISSGGKGVFDEDVLDRLTNAAKFGQKDSEKAFSSATQQPPTSTLLDSDSDDDQELATCISEQPEELAAWDSSFSSESEMDINSEDFRSLPAEVQREILVDMQERGRESRLRPESLPSESNEFSSFQLGRLLKKGQVNQKLDAIHRELTARNTVVSCDWLSENFCDKDLNSGGFSVWKVVQESLKKQHILIEEREEKKEEILRKIQKLDGECIQPQIPDEKMKHTTTEDFKKPDGENTGEMVVSIQKERNFSEENSSSEPARNGENFCEFLEKKSKESVVLEPSIVESVQARKVEDSSPLPDDHETVEIITEAPVSVPNNNLTEARVTLQTEKVEETDGNGFSDDDDFVEVEELDPQLLFSSFQSAKRSSCEVPSKRNSHSPKNSNTDEQQTLEETKTFEPTNFGCEDFKSLEALNNEKRTKQGAEVSMTEKIYQDCQELLKLFGIPYLVAPGEAEAQCAFLEQQGLTGGTISDDSDVWLFGAKKVYRNIFNRTRHVQFFRDSDLVEKLGLSRSRLIQMAMLTGCDYTDGVENVGVVLALEILSEFSHSNDRGVEPLQRFREWWTKVQTTERPPGSEVKARLRKLACKFPPSFPDAKIFEAYSKPNVEISEERFSWGEPDTRGLKQFAEIRMGWMKQKAEELLLPLLKTTAPGSQFQTHINSFMVKLDKDPQQMKIAPSKRVEHALKKLKGGKLPSEPTFSDSKLDESGGKIQVEEKSEVLKKFTRNIVGKNMARRKRKAAVSKRKAVGKIKELKISESSSSESD